MLLLAIAAVVGLVICSRTEAVEAPTSTRSGDPGHVRSWKVTGVTRPCLQLTLGKGALSYTPPARSGAFSRSTLSV
jgi:hypothetical protein